MSVAMSLLPEKQCLKANADAVGEWDAVRRETCPPGARKHANQAHGLGLLDPTASTGKFSGTSWFCSLRTPLVPHSKTDPNTPIPSKPDDRSLKAVAMERGKGGSCGPTYLILIQWFSWTGLWSAGIGSWKKSLEEVLPRLQRPDKEQHSVWLLWNCLLPRLVKNQVQMGLEEFSHVTLGGGFAFNPRGSVFQLHGPGSTTLLTKTTTCLTPTHSISEQFPLLCFRWLS